MQTSTQRACWQSRRMTTLEQKCAGAGVVCYALDDNNEIVILLGKEREVVGWKQGSRRWGAFSGRAEDGEDALRCAAREFVEETCASIPLDVDMAIPTSTPVVLSKLEMSPIFCRTCQRTTPVPVEFSHTSYLCRIAYREAYTRTFHLIRSQLVEVEAALREYQVLRKTMEHIPRLLLPGYAVAPTVVAVDFTVDSLQKLLSVEYRDSERQEEKIELTFAASPAACYEALNLWHAWKALELWVVAREHEPIFCHPAVQIHRHCGRITHVEVRRSYFEKTEVAWWRLEDLEALSRSGDRWRLDAFRRYFLENITDIGDQIRSLFRQA